MDKIEQIMNSKSDSKMFAELVNRQRKNNNCHVQSIMINDIIYDTPEEMCDGWAMHFEMLATPLDRPSFNSQHQELVESDIDSI